MKIERTFERSGFRGTLVLHSVDEWIHSVGTEQSIEVENEVDRVLDILASSLSPIQEEANERRNRG